MTVPDRLHPDPSVAEVFAQALRGETCSVIGLGRTPALLPVGRWRGDAQDADLRLLDQCRGRTIDVGCGPGRLTKALADRGHSVLGIDVVDEAVEQTLRRGVAALRCDVFGDVPDVGSWDTVLLADGNIGIGGRPDVLLDRARELLAPGGRVVVEVEARGTTAHSAWITVEVGGIRSRAFPWAVLGADDVADVGARAGLQRSRLVPIGHGRWCAILSSASV